MICKDLTERIKSILGNRYTSQILDYLEEREITNENGKPYSRSYISHIVNGIRENVRIENVIIELCEERLKQVKNLSLRRRRKLKIE